jgi:hypothetical protein
MKILQTFALGLFTALLLFSCKNEKSSPLQNYILLVTASDDASGSEAAKIIARYYKDITGSEIAIKTSVEPGERSISIGSDLVPDQWKDSLSGLA